MDGLSRPAGAQATCTLGGKTYRVGPFTLQDLGTCEAHLIRLRRMQKLQLIADQRKFLPKDIWQEEWDKAKVEAEKIIEIPEGEMAGLIDKNTGKSIVDEAGNPIKEGWLDTREGLCFCFWVLFEKSYPGEFTLEQLTDIFHTLKMEDIENLKIARDMTAGLDQAAKNLTGPTSPQTTSNALLAAAPESGEVGVGAAESVGPSQDSVGSI